MKTSIRRPPDTDPFRKLSPCRGFFVPAAGNRNWKLWLLIAVLFVLLAYPVSTEAQDTRGIHVSAERLALIVGNNSYQTAPLRNPVNDAEDMGAVLSELGFKVTLKKNVDRRGLEDAIRQFGKQLRHGGVGLFYFAGHGLQVGGRNYLIPINARIESESDVSYEAVDAGFVLGKMEDAQNQLNIVILDACRSNPFARSFRSENMGLAKMDAPTGSLIVYATAPGDVAADGPERNGVFTRHLLRHMQAPNLPVEQVLKRVRIDVAAETKQRQIPWESSSLMGDFYFKTGSEKNLIISKQHEKAELSDQINIQSSNIIRTNSFNTKKVAIFPISEDYRAGAWLSQIENIDELVIIGLQKAIISKNSLQAKYSYYNLEPNFRTEKIPDKILNTETKGNLWIKNDYSGTKKPNLELLCSLGSKLNVDAIITYRVYYDTRTVNVSAFLIDVENKKIDQAHEKDSSLDPTVSSEFRSEIEWQIMKVTSNILKEFN
jgi:hypothetical protein